MSKLGIKGSNPGQTGTFLGKELIPYFTRKGDLVVDPMAGVGSILVSAARLGRRALGIEISPEYAQDAGKWLDTDPDIPGVE